MSCSCRIRGRNTSISICSIRVAAMRSWYGLAWITYHLVRCQISLLNHVLKICVMICSSRVIIQSWICSLSGFNWFPLVLNRHQRQPWFESGTPFTSARLTYQKSGKSMILIKSVIGLQKSEIYKFGNNTPSLKRTAYSLIWKVLILASSC